MGNIAIIGFAKEVPVKNKFLAFIVGGILSAKGINVIAGNVVGTFIYAFCGAKLLGGKSLAIVDSELNNQPFGIDQLIFMPTSEEKHQFITLISSAAIVIGGGNQSLHLVKAFLKQGKPIIAIAGTKGIVDSEVEPLGVKVTGVFNAMSHIFLALNKTEELNA